MAAAGLVVVGSPSASAAAPTPGTDAALGTGLGTGADVGVLSPGEAPSRDPSAPIRGFVDAHTHVSAGPSFGGALRYGRAFAPGGLGEALADCPTHSGTGHMALLESILGGGDLPMAPQGFPTFSGWPAHDTQLHEQAYYKGIERAWRSGQRILNNYLVGNRTLCELVPGGVSSCDEMDQLRLQLDYLNRMEAHIDAEYGGPGRGWFSGARAGTAVPVYPEGPACNARGLSSLGEHAIRGIMARGMVINIEHMSVKAATRTLDIAEEVGYTALAADHTWADHALIRRLHDLGGFVASCAFPADHTEAAEDRFQDDWKLNVEGTTRPWSGYGFGSDVNGLGPLADPRPSAATDPLAYPFTAPNGAVLDRWRLGERVYDLNHDGVAQYGLYADWVADVLHMAGPDRAELERQLMSGAEAWVRTWESAR